MRLAVDAEEADGRRNRRLELTRRRSLQTSQRFERAFVTDLSECQRGIVLQRTIELGDGDERVERVRRLVVSKRFNDGTAKEVLAAPDLLQ